MVKHVLKDGTEVDDIEGMIVKVEYAENLYRLLTTINSNPKRLKGGLVNGKRK